MTRAMARKVASVLAASVATALPCSVGADPVAGAWESPQGDNWPLVAAHASLTPEGRVLSFGSDQSGRQTGFFSLDLWDPAAGLTSGHVTVENRTGVDVYCGTQLLSSGGRLLIAGGDNWTGQQTSNTGNRNTVIYSDGVLTRGTDMLRARWCPSGTTLANGDIYIQGGQGGGDKPEVRSANGSFRLLSGVDTSALESLNPRNFLAPDGRIFGFDANGTMYFVDTAGTGSKSPAGRLASEVAGQSSSAAMYLPGRILQVGGNSSRAVTIDIRGPQPVVANTQPLTSQRQWVSTTVLADGRVLATGGSAEANALNDVNTSAELWDPATGTWTVGASSQRPRLFNSTALLLPDAAVLVAGGGAPGPLTNLNAEIYYPPYLFDANGGLASRPTILTAPDVIRHGDSLLVESDTQHVRKVTLVRTGSVTHGVNADQRFLELRFQSGSDVLFVQAPDRATDAPPGYYLLFVIDDRGVPSVGRIVRIAGQAEESGTPGASVGAGIGGGPIEDIVALDANVWPETAVPDVVSAADTNSVELGVKFRANVNGYVTGLRFYKGPSNTGTHVGNLWTATGTRLATATFTNETASGWQQVNFASPVAITANTVYVASYFAPQGGYSYTRQYFAGGGITVDPLYLLGDVEGGGNGLYQYSGSTAFPTNSYQATNYWVDVVFDPVAPGADTTPPTVVSRSPAQGATAVALNAPVAVGFSEPIDATTVNAATLEIRDPSNALVPVGVTYSAVGNVATITPSAPLSGSTTYTVVVRGGATDPRVKDLAGNALAANSTWIFTTVAPRVCTGNPIVVENCRAGNPSSEWEVNGEGDASIQGFATAISSNRGETVQFKVKTDASSYRIDIYRLGYYDGLGARRVATVQPTASLPQTQPNCLLEATTGLIDCGNWAVSASWDVPPNAVSGVYIARLVRGDNNGASHIPFVVRDDAGESDVLFQTADTTWQAYNTYGGNSLYQGQPAGRAYKVSYNRPFNTRRVKPDSYLFNAEYPMIRWLEANGYGVSYTTGVDSDRRGSLIRNSRVFMSNGHDEYWSGAQRSNVEGARDAGVNLAFFSGNEVFWKIRWENSIDGATTPYRTLVCYKETHADAKIDPSAAWTGTWRDPRFSPPADGGRPENRLTGTIFTVNDGATSSIVVPAEDGRLRFWRGTSVASLPDGSSATLPFGTLGYEWNEDLDNGFRPPGLFRMSSTTVSDVPLLQDWGSTYASGTATHSLTMYRAASGALVFGAGTIQWAWGLDSVHDRGSGAADPRMQQATVNLLADMAVQPGSLQSGLSLATTSTDATPPASTIVSPSEGGTLNVGQLAMISGTASDSGGGVVGGVEVSVDGGTVWHRANGRSSWFYSWVPLVGGEIRLLSRAVDDSGNLEPAGPGRLISVGTGGTACPCGMWDATAIPNVAAATDTGSVELGVKFRSSVDGYVTGIRFYKGAGNSGTHTGSLWTLNGSRLATATFVNETASGWQQVTFGSPVPVTANTIYVASYLAPAGRYSYDRGFFATQGLSNGPLYFLRDGESGGNGLYVYGSGGVVPSNSYLSTNYWVDVVFETAVSGNVPPVLTNPGAQSGTAGVAIVPLQLQASDGNNDPLTFSATGLPAGLSISAGGLITGTPSAAGTASVTATVSDGRGGSDTEPFSWVIQPTADTTPPSAPSGLAVTGTTTSSITLDWEASTDTGGSGLTGYRIYRDGSTTPLTASQALMVAFAVPSTADILTSATVEGFDFTSWHFHLAGDGTYSSNGTTYLAYETNRGYPITMSKSGGGTFSLREFDAAEWGDYSNPDRIPADSIGLIGYRADGSTVSAVFGLDRINDGGAPGSANDFQHFTLPAEFSGLTSVLFYGVRVDGSDGGIAVDNLVIDIAAPGGGVVGTSFTDAGLAPGTSHSYVVKAYDGAGNESAPSNSVSGTTGGTANVAPVLVNPGAQSGTAGVAIVPLQLQATDGNAGDTLTFSASGLPAGLAISAGGLITGTPSAAGTASVTATVSDGRGGTDSETFSWVIAAGNVAPVLVNPGAQSGTAGVAIVPLQLQATDGNAGDTLTFSASGLPAGLAISAGGLITGTPSAAGTASVTATVSDGRGGTDSETFSWVIAAGNVAPVLVNPGAQSGTAGVAIVPLQLQATDGNAGDTLTFSASGLPAGLAISAGGLITGTPSAAGTASVTATVSDGRGGTDSETFSWVIAAGNVAPVLVNPGAQSGTAGVAIVPLQLQATDGNAGDTLTFSASGLPAGLAISAGGLITGTPSAAGTASVTATVSDGRGGTDSETFSWVIAAGNVAPVLVNPGAQSGTAGVAIVPLQLQATDGNAGDTLTFSASGLPAGLAISAGGLITGTPSAAGTASVTATVSDGRGGTDSETFSWVIAAGNVAPVLVNPGAQSGTAGVAIVPLQLQATDGNAGDTLTFSASGLPAGLAISAGGLITGTPSAAGTASVTATVSDGRGGTDSETFSWVIAAGNVAPVLVNPGAQSGTAGVAIVPLQLQATDGNAGDTLTFSASGLPAGLAISAGGLITGTPSAAGTASVTATVSDGRGGTDSETFSWVIAAGNVAPVLVNPGAQSGTAGVAIVPLQLQATDGNAGDTLTFSASGLPAGLAISAGGLITGTPSAAGTASVTATVSDGRGGTDSETFSWVIAAGNVAPVLVNPGAQSGTAGVAIVPLQLQATDGNAGDTLTFSASGLPAGLAISAGGLITGTPSAAGTASVTATVSDGRGGTDSETFSWVIAAGNVAPVLVNPGAQSGTAGVAIVPLQLQATDGNAGDTLTFSASGLPAGLAISAGGLITGTPSAAGTASVTATVSDGRGGTDSETFSWVIAAGNGACPCSIWGVSAVPSVAAATDTGSVELGVKFRSSVNGFVTGIRFYKGAGNSGTHTGSLWAPNGTRLATATFANETASGWQQVMFATPVPIVANTVYVASYLAPVGRYSYDRGFFATQGLPNGPLYFLSDGESGGNGVYVYSLGGQMPSNSYQSSNYWVDVVFETQPSGNLAPVLSNPGAQSGTAGVAIVPLQLQATDGNAGDTLTFSASGLPAGLAISTSGLITGMPSAAGTSSVTVTVDDGHGGTDSETFSWVIAATNGACPCSIWGVPAVPSVVAATDTRSVELGVKFRSSANGYVTGIRFYKGAGNSGTHTGSLWALNGTRLATATFANETASGWQQVMFTTPVPIVANTVYVASYLAPVGRYSYDRGYFAAQGLTSGPLYILRDGESGGNGLYVYSLGGQMPSNSYQSSNYWVDVVFATEP